MNDCLWFMICICECENGRCDKYLSVNGDKGQEIAGQYDKDVEKALEPVRENYKQKYLSNEPID